LVREALKEFSQPTGTSEILEGSAVIDSGSRKHSVQVHGIRIEDHILASNLENQIIRGKVSDFAVDENGCLVGNSVAERLRLQLGDRVVVQAGAESRQFRVVGIFETGVSQIDKKRIFLHHSATKSLFGRSLGRTIFQLSIQEPDDAVDLAHQMQLTLGHRVISWQEREKVWLEVFRALRASSAITVSSILLLAGLGIFNVFAIMVIEKTRDIAILRSMGFSPREVSSVFLWQGGIVLFAGIILGCLVGFLATYGISKIPMRIRGIFSTDSFVVNWDANHYLWAILIASLFVSIASWIPARRAARIEPAKIIRETI
jgi:lipoprotein-releasing system permease protein